MATPKANTARQINSAYTNDKIANGKMKRKKITAEIVSVASIRIARVQFIDSNPKGSCSSETSRELRSRF